MLKNKITKITFSGGRSERGYERFFARLLLGMGAAEYGITLNAERELKSTHPPLRLGVEAGWQVIDYHLALHGGLEYNHSNFTKSVDPSYNYLNLNLGASYYLPLNFYISPQVRLILNGSASFQSEHVTEEINVPIEGEGLGFGISIGKEWYTDTRMIWGVALTYTRDSLKSQPDILGGLPQGDPVPILGTPSRPIVELTETQTELDYIGITFSLAYD